MLWNHLSLPSNPCGKLSRYLFIYYLFLTQQILVKTCSVPDIVLRCSSTRHHMPISWAFYSMKTSCMLNKWIHKHTACHMVISAVQQNRRMKKCVTSNEGRMSRVLESKWKIEPCRYLGKSTAGNRKNKHASCEVEGTWNVHRQQGVLCGTAEWVGGVGLRDGGSAWD